MRDDGSHWLSLYPEWLLWFGAGETTLNNMDIVYYMKGISSCIHFFFTFSRPGPLVGCRPNPWRRENLVCKAMCKSFCGWNWLITLSVLNLVIKHELPFHFLAITSINDNDPVYTEYSTSWLLIAWRRKEPWHQQPWNWPHYLNIIAPAMTARVTCPYCFLMTQPSFRAFKYREILNNALGSGLMADVLQTTSSNTLHMRHQASSS